jgi:hypothetical protein
LAPLLSAFRVNSDGNNGVAAQQQKERRGEKKMKSRILKSIYGAALLILASSVQPTSVKAQAEGGGLEGTWINDVKIVACSPAPPIIFASFQSMTTYMSGGTMIEGAAPAFPAASRSESHGIWEHTSGHKFREFFRFSSLDTLGRVVSRVEVTVHGDLIKGDNPETPDVLEPYYFSQQGTNKITNINPLDGTVINVIEGCSVATSRPVLFED